jgi:peptidoglycan/LPS O-acetylase OafA/YrhL
MHGYGPIALFTLSGFLLHRPFGRWALGVSERPDLWVYGVRRVLRIYPAYLVCLHLWYLIWQSASPTSFSDYLKDVTMVSTLQFFHLVEGLRQTWSMGVELTWYLVLPFMAMGIHRIVRRVPQHRKLRVHSLLLLASVPFSCAYVAWTEAGTRFDSATMWFPKFLICFALGALLSLHLDAERAGMTKLSRLRHLGQGLLYPSVALALVVLNISPLAGPKEFVVLPLHQLAMRELSSLGLVMVMLMIAVFSPPGASVVRFLNTRFMQATGRWSYGIYLWHLPVITLIFHESGMSAGPLGLVLVLVIVLVPSYLLGAASYAFVEQPSMEWSKNLTSGAKGARRAGGAAHDPSGVGGHASAEQAPEPPSAPPAPGRHR